MIETQACRFRVLKLNMRIYSAVLSIVYVTWFDSVWQVCDCCLVSFITSLNGVIDVLHLALKLHRYFSSNHNCVHPKRTQIFYLIRTLSGEMIRGKPWNCFVITILRPRKIYRHFEDDICKCISLNENYLISIRISAKFVSMGPFDHMPSLVQIMVRCLSGLFGLITGPYTRRSASIVGSKR